MSKRLFVFDTHPIPYRVPIWQSISKNHPGLLHVVYASDFILRGNFRDSDFGRNVTWDEPLLNDYECTILNCEKGEPFSSWGSFTGKGVPELIKKARPAAILLMGLNFKYELVAYFTAIRLGIPVWLRCETQDFSAVRSFGTRVVRSLVYRTLYPGLSKIFYIGEYNKMHYLAHGVGEHKLIPARYCTPDRIEALTHDQRVTLRDAQRESAKIAPDSFVVGFAGKLIEKKNPKILYEMLDSLPEDLRRRTHLYFMGSGELDSALKALAETAADKYGVKSYFSGFVNQTKMPPHYLAMDIMILPSRRMGETWGLVCNEAMQAGAGVIVSSAVGCGGDFGKWERFRVFEEGNPKALAAAVSSLAKYRRDFDWARAGLRDYSVDASAEAIANALIAEGSAKDHARLAMSKA